MIRLHFRVDGDELGLDDGFLAHPVHGDCLDGELLDGVERLDGDLLHHPLGVLDDPLAHLLQGFLRDLVLDWRK